MESFKQTLKKASRVQIAIGIVISVLTLALIVGGITAAILYRKHQLQLLKDEEDARIAKSLAEEIAQRSQIEREKEAEKMQNSRGTRLFFMIISFIMDVLYPFSVKY